MAQMRVAVVTHEFEDLKLDKDGMSIGESVDSFIRQKLRDGKLIREFHLEFSDEESFKLQAQAHSTDYAEPEPVLAYNTKKKPGDPVSWKK